MKDVEHIRKILELHIRRLQHLERQEAYKGINTEPEILMEIEDLKEKIREIERQSDLITIDLDPEKRAEIKAALEMTGQTLRKVEDYLSYIQRRNRTRIATIEKTLDFFSELLEVMDEVTEMIKGHWMFLYCPYCRSSLSAFVEEKVSYECGYSALIQDMELTNHKELVPCPNKVPNQEKWDENWRGFTEEDDDEVERPSPPQVGECVAGAEIKMPPAYGTFKQAQKVDDTPKVTQHKMDLD